MANAHAYTILGTATINGNNLIKMRNPWGKETYHGPMDSNDPAFTDSMKNAVGYTDDNDGIFFIPDVDFLKAFEKFAVAYYSEKAQISWY